MALKIDNLVANRNGVYADDTSKFSDLDLMASTINSVLWSGMKSQTQKNQGLINLATIAIALLGSEFVIAHNKHNLDDRKQSGLPDFTKLHQTEVPVVGKVDEPDQPADANAVEGTAVSNKRSISIVTSVRQSDGSSAPKVRLFVPKFKSGEVIFSPQTAVRVTLTELLQADFLTLAGVTAKKIMLLKSPKEDSMSHAEMRLLRYAKDKRSPLTSIGVSKPCCHFCAEALDEAGVAFTRWSMVRNMSGWNAPERIKDTQAEAI